VLIFNQRSVQEILDMILALASLVGASEKGMRLVQTLEDGLEGVRRAASAFSRRRRDPLRYGLRQPPARSSEACSR